MVDAVEPRIRELLQACPTMPATVIAERIGWTRSITVLKDRVAELRPVYLPPDPASRTTYVAGEIAQCDLWFPPIELPVGFGQTRTATQLPVLTMVTGYSRWLSAVLIPSRTAEDLFAGWWRLLRAARRGAAGAGLGRGGRGRPVAARQAGADRGVPGVPRRRWARRCIDLQAGRPGSQGADRAAPTAIWRRSFLPGRTFTCPADFNTQLQAWLAVANTAAHAVAGLRPDGADRRRPGGDAGAAAGAAGDRVASTRLRLPRDHYVRLDTNDYSVHPAVIGRRIEVRRRPGPGPGVLRRAGWSPTTTGSGPGTRPSPTPTTWPPRRLLRREPRSAWCGRPRRAEVEQRRLADYDTALGVADRRAGWRDGRHHDRPAPAT